MVENVQCPVCTLFLHAGMNLSDHLETHPKEQVIKALVQLTMTGGAVSGAVAAALCQGEKKPEIDVKSGPDKEPDLSNSNSASNSCASQSSATTTPTATSNQNPNFAATFSAKTIPQKQQQQHAEDNMSNTQCAAAAGGVNSGDGWKPVFNQQTPSATMQSYQLGGSSSVVSEIASAMPSDFSTFAAHRYKQQQQIQTANSQLHQQQQAPLLQQHVSVAAHAHRHVASSLPPPPPLPAAQQMLPNTFQTLQHTLFTASPSATNTNLQLHLQQQHQQQQHQQQQHQQHQQQQPQNMKTIYSPNLPPPPPLQLFSYQPTTQLQHQKPPPAYGTAISQIRSQHNQNKQHTAVAIPAVTSQQQQQHLRIAPPPSSHHTAPPPPPSNAVTTTNHLFQGKAAAELPPPPLPATTISAAGQQPKYLDDLMQQKQPPPQQQQQQQHFVASISNGTNSQEKLVNASQRATPLLATTATPMPTAQAPQQQTLAPSVVASTSNSIACVGFNSSGNNNSRQTNSPYAALFPPAAPSPSSVLRYAESPVAHYLERDNGDFIVQETPKHIVECVEKDNGEFSVIERIYQSPPSVLHIHDDDEDDDEEAEEDDTNEAAEEDAAEHIRTDKNESDSCLLDEHQDFMSAASDSDQEESDAVDQKTKNELSGKQPSQETSASLNAASGGSNSNSAMNSNSNNAVPTARRKSSKNHITVLSDVQLDLKEYLDLVGNIIASSKIAAQRAKFAGTAPMPLLKVEKEEPPDDYEMQEMQSAAEEEAEADGEQQFQQQDDDDSRMEIEEQEQPQNELEAAPAVEVKTEPPPTIANKHETDELVENNCSKIETSLNEKKNAENSTTIKAEAELKRENWEYIANEHNVAAVATAATCASHVTSVIRMATTSQQQQQQHQPQHHQQQQQQHQQLAIETNAAERYGIFTPCTSAQHVALTNNIASMKEEEYVAQDLSQSQLQLKTELAADEEEEAEKQQHELQDEQQCNNTETSAFPQQTQQQPPPPLKKGPKKLVIKPKSIKTDTNANNRTAIKHEIATATTTTSTTTTIKMSNADDSPTTSAKAQQQKFNQREQKHPQQEKQQKQEAATLPADVFIKSEPNATTYEQHAIGSSGNSNISILEQHLKLGVQQQKQQQQHKFDLVCKEEKLHAQQQQEQQQQQLPPQNEAEQPKPLLKVEPAHTDLIELQTTQEHVADDAARVLLDFANSKKHTNSAANFLSSTSIFSTAASLAATITKATNSAAAAATTAVGDCSSLLVSSLRCDDEYIATDGSDVVQEIVISSSYSSQSASDVVHCSSAATTNDSHHNQQPQQQSQQQQQQQQHSFTDYAFSFLYGGGNVAQQVDAKGISFSPIYTQAQDTTTAATLASGSNSITIEDSSSTHTTHRQQHNGQQQQHQQQQNRFDAAPISQWYHHAASTANSDFEAALAVDCSAAVDGCGDVVGKYLDLDACKRESLVGVQAAASSTSSSFAAATESSLAGGCTTDGLNIRTDEKMPAKGEISEQESNCDIENSWSQPMYGDISARFFKTSFPGIFQQENGWNNDEYFTVHDLSASTNAVSTAEHPDVLPSTSAATNKKKRKRDTHAEKAPASRAKPTSTITSQQFVVHQQHPAQQYNLQVPQQQQQQQAHSSILMAGPSTAAAAAAAVASSSSGLAASAGGGLQVKPPRKKIYQCTHCMAEFSKLKDRNSHMIDEHNYVRQNRRLVCLRTGNSTATTATITSGELASTTATAGSSSSGNLLLPQVADIMEDSKQAIVKIEVEHAEQQVALTIGAGVAPKSEYIDEKEALALASNSPDNVTANSVSTIAAISGDAKNGELSAEDSKLSLQQPLSVSTPATKLATLYRMLVSYNISTLKQNQQLSEFEEKFIETSIFFCYICRQNFTSVKLYDAHLTEHPAECFTCGKKFHRWKNFSLHLKRHLGWKEFGCSVCDKKFVVRSALVEHMRMHTGLTPLKCKICGKNFKRYSNLTQHRKRHGKQLIRKKEYVCHCGEVLPSKARFLWHKETHDPKPKCCPYCCDRFVHANSLSRHIRLAHSDKFDYTAPMECPMCKQIFAKSSIKAHMATHSMDTQHDCPICNKSFSTKWNLKIHSWVHANRTAKPFKCEHCPKAFVREVDYKNHINAHKQIKPYTCEYCGCKFIRKYNYMRHRREHHGNKKFTCDLCKKSFHRHYYLIEHRRIHTGERPFVCTICGKSSTTKTNHNKHLKIHHSRDPFTVEA